MINKTYRKKLDSEGNPVIENGDFVMELVTEVVLNIPDVPVDIKWKEMLRDLLTPTGSIITRMRATAKTTIAMSVEFTTVLIVIQNGVNGFPDESTLQTLLRMNWGFTAGEKATINTYLTNNNFNISVL